VQKIDFNTSRLFPRIVSDYLLGADSLKKFYRFPHHIDSFQTAIAAKQFNATQRALLTETLMSQYKNAGIELDEQDLVYKNIVSLKENNTYTITTGHQLCVLTGPLYFLEKIIHVIKLAKSLSENNSQNHLVPLFWMASEDHDFTEISSLNINGQHYSWEKETSNAPVGRINSKDLEPFFELLKPHISELHADFFESSKQIYLSSTNLSEATRKLVHLIFSKYGLVVIDGDDIAFKKSFQQVIYTDILTGLPFQALHNTNKELSILNYHQQVNGRSCNHFYIHEGKRLLIEKSKDVFTIKDSDIEFTKQEMEAEIANHPEKFSPNVVMRPVYQEFIIPNLAYIGGPGEVSYWLQLYSVFTELGVSYPIIVCRNTFLFTDVYTRRILKKLYISWSDLFAGRETVCKNLLQKLIPTSEESLIKDTQTMFQNLIGESEKLDNKISAELIKAKNNQLSVLKKSVKHLNRVKKIKLDKELKEIEQVYEAIFPNNAPSERTYNVLSLSVNIDTFIDIIYTNSSPIIDGVVIIDL
jgi:bacillithiol biosynthesis cysteine-adding enzyme BshC